MDKPLDEQAFAASPNVTFDIVHAYALENLRLRTNKRSYETHGYRARTTIVCETRDGCAATRILLPELMEKWSRCILGNMLLGIPNRDFMIAFSDRDQEHVQAIVHFAQIHSVDCLESSPRF
jgi:uncharacterized protein YtpQ (UPF0354 family)